MKKTITVLGFVLALGSAAQAQTVYGNVGFQSRGLDSINFTGFSAGAGFGFTVANFDAVALEPRLSVNYASTRSAPGAPSATFGGFSADLAVLAKFDVDAFTLYAGPNVGFGSYGATSAGNPTVPVSALEFGVVAGADYSLDSNLGLFVEGAFNRITYSANNTTVGGSIFGIKLGATYKL